MVSKLVHFSSKDHVKMGEDLVKTIAKFGSNKSN